MKRTFISAIQAAGSNWNRFWFAPVSAFNFALFRTGLGLLTFIWLVTLLPDFDAFFGTGSLAMERSPGTGWFSIFQWFESDTFLQIGLGLGLAASGTLIFGKLTRVGGPALALLIPSIMTDNLLLWNAGDHLLQTLLLLFGFYCLLTPSSDLDTPLQFQEPASKDRLLSNSGVWLFQLVKIQMAIVYLVAFIAKVPGSTWRDGTASMIVFRLENMERFHTPGWLETNFLIGNTITWASLALEAALPILLWKRSTRPYAIAAAAVFHLVIDWTLTIGLFSWIMILGLTAFLPSDLSARLQSMGRRLKTYRPSSHSSIGNSA